MKLTTPCIGRISQLTDLKNENHACPFLRSLALKPRTTVLLGHRGGENHEGKNQEEDGIRNGTEEEKEEEIVTFQKLSLSFDN